MVTLWDGDHSIANVDFELEDGVLDLGVMHVSSNYRRAGISSVLLAKILAKYPNIHEIRMGSFTHETNYEVVATGFFRNRSGFYRRRDFWIFSEKTVATQFPAPYR